MGYENFMNDSYCRGMREALLARSERVETVAPDRCPECGGRDEHKPSCSMGDSLPC